jgi:hypothetical protein
MKTITFYSYKGGTGRSLALANAARYLARLDFKVVALDFDLEAPGLHYKFSLSTDGKPLPVKAGLVDYLHAFVVEGQIPKSLEEFTQDVNVPGVDGPLVQLIPAGRVPSRDYWSKLSRINWHELFYSKGATGVQVFLDLKDRIANELRPDFLLIDSRTGITEMGGVATTLLAETVICLVLPTRENLEGARAILRSLNHSSRESGSDGLELIIAVSRLSDSESEQEVTDRIRTLLNEEAEDLADTLSCSDIFTFHSEAELQIHEALRVGSGISPDNSILLRDYLRLFAIVVPKDLIGPKVGNLIQKAQDKISVDPEAAVKELEEFAESFGHPELYSALLRFYEVRNIGGAPALQRAQRLWELTHDSHDPLIWQILNRTFEVIRSTAAPGEWVPDLDFVETVWRDAGNRNPKFAMKIAQVLRLRDCESHAADVLLESVAAYEPTPQIAARCIELLGASDRGDEAGALIQRLKPRMEGVPRFVKAWATYALHNNNEEEIAQLLRLPHHGRLGTFYPSIAALVYFRGGLIEEAAGLAEAVLGELTKGSQTLENLDGIGELFLGLNRWEEFEKVVSPQLSQQYLEELRRRVRRPGRR